MTELELIELISGIIVGIFMIFIVVFGISILRDKKKKKKVNMKEVISTFKIILLLKSLDMISTIYFVRKIGLEYEGNFMAKWFMETLGIYGGIITFLIISLPYLFCWFVVMNYAFKNKLGWKLFKWIMIVVGIIVPIINFSA